MRTETVRRLVRDILSLTYVAGNGGYVADIGPTTFGEMLRFVEAPEFRRIEDLRAWASGEHSDGQPAPQCPTDICSMCYPKAPCRGAECVLCGPLLIDGQVPDA